MQGEYVVTQSDQKDLLNTSNRINHLRTNKDPKTPRRKNENSKKKFIVAIIIFGIVGFTLAGVVGWKADDWINQYRNNQREKATINLQTNTTKQVLSSNTTYLQANQSTKPATPEVNKPPAIQAPPLGSSTKLPTGAVAVATDTNKPVSKPNKPTAVAGIDNHQREMAKRWKNMIKEDIFNETQMASQQRDYYQKKYNVSQYEELPFCIVIPSHNNVKGNRHINNLRSVLMQEYSNYHIVFIDDASTDGTGEQIERYLQNNQTKVPPERYIVVKNKEQKMAMPNLRKAATDYCKPQDIYLIADGDDQLLGRQVLKLFNSVFQKEGVWFLYSNFLTNSGGVGYSRPFPATTMQNNKYRSYPFVTSHLRAFYTQLFRNIKEKDLKDDKGQYLRAANDVAICVPILEMSHKRVKYLPELTYNYNANTGLNNHKLRLNQQKTNNIRVRQMAKYSPLEQLFPKSQTGSSEPPLSNSTQLAPSTVAQPSNPSPQVSSNGTSAIPLHN